MQADSETEDEVWHPGRKEEALPGEKERRDDPARAETAEHPGGRNP